MRSTFLSLLLMLVGASPSVIASPSRYAITDVGPVLSYKRVVINNKAQVAGTFETNIPLRNGDANAKAYHPFLWQHGRRRDLGIIGIYPSASVSAINDPGQVCGTLDASADGAILVYQNRAFLWSRGEMQDLGAPAGDELTRTYSMNNSGQIVGMAQDTGWPSNLDDPAAVQANKPRAALFSQGKWQVLGIGQAKAINDKGWIVGNASMPQEKGDVYAVLWKNGKPFDLGTTDNAVAINNKGQIILAWSSSITLWQNGKKVALNAPIGYQNTEGDYAINELGEIVGSADRVNAADDQRRAILWRDGNGYDLNTLIPTQSDWNLQQATDINDKGQIVGIGTLHGKTHAFLLTPRK